MRNLTFNASIACLAMAALCRPSSAQTPEVEARVFAFVDQHIAAATKLPATPEALKANVDRFQPPKLPPGGERYYQAALERFNAGIAPHLAKINHEAARRLEAGMSGKTVRTAETEQAHQLCLTTWTNDRALNSEFTKKCVKYPEELAAAACKAALERTNSKKLGHSRVIVAPDEKGKLGRIDFDQLVCAAAIDGFEVTVIKPWLFGSSTIELRSTIHPGHTISISISSRKEGGKPVWAATDIENHRVPFDSALETLACLQYDKRSAAPGLALDLVAAWGSDTLVDNPYAQGFLQGGMCVAWKNAWNMGLAQPEGLGAASILKQIFGN